jgi:phage-related protein
VIVDVAFTREAVAELAAFPVAERAALNRAIEKLRVFGDQLSYPHSSAVKGAKVRELRPRGGRSPWRAFDRRVGGTLVVGAIGPEATVNPTGFRRSVEAAEARLKSFEEEETQKE